MKKCLSVCLLSMLTQFSLAATDMDRIKALTGTCVTCHGASGNSANPIWPKIAGQNEKYLTKQMLDFKLGQEGGRFNAVMQGMVAKLSEKDIRDVAAYYASQSGSPGKAEKKYVELGQRLYRGGDRERGISACAACHGPAGRGNQDAGYPVLSGQHADYTAAQLKAYRDGSRSNDANGMMQDIAKTLTDADITAVASYISGLH